MTIRRRPRGEQIANPGRLLDTMGVCRKALIEAESGLKPFGMMYHGCSMVVRAIDALAHLITGEPDFYHAMGSTPAPGRRRWTGDKPERDG